MGLLALTGCRVERAAPPTPTPTTVEPGDPAEAQALAWVVDRVRAHRAALARTPDLEPEVERALGRLPYRFHVEMGDSLGTLAEDGAQIRQLVRAGTLVPLTDTEHYIVTPLEYSRPFVTPDTRRMLDEVGQRFHAALRERGLPPFRFIVTSALRTEETQLELTGVNRNARRSRSSHEYGTTVDIVYTRFRYAPDSTDALPADLARPLHPATRRGVDEIARLSFDGLSGRYWQSLQGVLGRVLLDMQRRERVIVLMEYEQPVFHITLWTP